MSASCVKKLSDVVTLSTGHTFRSRAEADQRHANIRLIQIKDVREEGVDLRGLPYANVARDDVKVLLVGGEILFPLKGGRHAAMMLTTVSDDMCVTTTNQVAVLSNPDATITMQYLLWYLNTDFCRRQVDRIRVGATVPHISLKHLEQIDLPVPSRSVQDRVFAIYENWKSQLAVLRALEDNGRVLTETACLNMAGMSKGC